MPAETTLYTGPLGRIITYREDPTLHDAWDATGEYVGGFNSYLRAMEALEEARDVHQRLVNAYDNRIGES
jgi:hypothetical protein